MADEEKKKKEIVVRAPPKPVTPAEKKAEKAAEKALEEERFGVLKISREVGMLFSASMLTAGVLSLFVFAYSVLTGQTEWIVSPKTSLLNLALWVFVGIANIVGGLLLMGSE